MQFLNIDTGEAWTLHELQDAFKDDIKHDSFEDFLDDLLEQGANRTGGFVPAYVVFPVCGEHDGEFIFATEYESEAILFAREYEKEHCNDINYLGVSILDPNGNEVMNWQ